MKPPTPITGIDINRVGMIRMGLGKGAAGLAAEVALRLGQGHLLHAPTAAAAGALDNLLMEVASPRTRTSLQDYNTQYKVSMTRHGPRGE